jgi:Tfp pilus assembly protein PilO
VSVAARKPARRPLLLAVLVLLGVNVAVFAVYTLPRTIQVRRATSRAAQARAEVERERKDVADLRGRADALRANTADAERFYASVDPRSDLLQVLAEVERMAREPGLKSGGRTFAPAEASDPRLSRIKVNLPMAGTYEQLVGFLERVERSPHFLTVDRISLTSGEDATGLLQVELSAYFGGSGGAVAKP